MGGNSWYDCDYGPYKTCKWGYDYGNSVTNSTGDLYGYSTYKLASGGSIVINHQALMDAVMSVKPPQQYYHPAYVDSIPYENENPLWINQKITAGKREIELPDGAKLIVDDQGNYRIEDKDAKVTYQANRIRDWSPYLNASDMVAEFVKYVGSIGVKQKDVLGLPLELFINWLIIEAAERDKDPVPPDVKPVQKHRAIRDIRKPRCWDCGRFVKPRLFERTRFPFCDPYHAQRYLEKKRVLLPSP